MTNRLTPHIFLRYTCLLLLLGSTCKIAASSRDIESSYGTNSISFAGDDGLTDASFSFPQNNTSLDGSMDFPPGGDNTPIRTPYSDLDNPFNFDLNNPFDFDLDNPFDTNDFELGRNSNSLNYDLFPSSDWDLPETLSEYNPNSPLLNDEENPFAPSFNSDISAYHNLQSHTITTPSYNSHTENSSNNSLGFDENRDDPPSPDLKKPTTNKPAKKKQPRAKSNKNLAKKKSCRKDNKHEISPSLKKDKKPHKAKTYTCDFCIKTFAKIAKLTNHISRFHVGDKPFYCPACNKQFSTKSGLDKHKNTSHAKKNKGGKDPINKDWHLMLTSHPQLDKAIQGGMLCLRCCHKSSSPKAAKVHKKGCEENFACHYCTTFFGKSKSMIFHYLYDHFYHKNPFACNIKRGGISCGKRFPTQGAFFTHQKSCTKKADIDLTSD